MAHISARLPAAERKASSRRLPHVGRCAYGPMCLRSRGQALLLHLSRCPPLLPCILELLPRPAAGSGRPREQVSHPGLCTVCTAEEAVPEVFVVSLTHAPYGQVGQGRVQKGALALMLRCNEMLKPLKDGM